MDVVANNNILLKLLVVIGITVFKCVVTQKCTPVSPLPQSQECFRPVDTTVGHCAYNDYTCDSRPDAIKWRLVSETSGRVDVTFRLPLNGYCNKTQYDVELQLSDDPRITDEETCAKNKHFSLTHTKQRIYYVRDECSNADNCPLTCDEEGTASFQFIFTGCYRIEIRPWYETIDAILSQTPISSCPKYFNTSYAEALLLDEIPTFETEYHDNRRNSPVTITFEPLTCNHLDLVIKLIANVSDLALGEACYNTGRVHSLCPLRANRSSTCDNNTNCNIVENRVHCLFSNMGPGNYCVLLEIQDERCDADTLWTKHSKGSRSTPCIWHNSYVALAGSANNSDYIETPPVYNSQSYTTFGGILFIATILSAIAVCFSLKMFSNRRTSKADLETLECATTVEPSRILLLYARDCLPFMDLMRTLRQLLEDAASSEVYDCFDGSRWPELSRNPVEWMRSLITQETTKIILVATHCSSLRHQALRDNTVVRYKEPSSNDDLFLYALQTLTDSSITNVYKRIFVVRFEGVADDGDLFALLNSFTRFVLPLHLDKLVFHLNESEFARVKETEVQSIYQDLTHLANYIKQNDSYLQNMLTIEKASS